MEESNNLRDLVILGAGFSHAVNPRFLVTDDLGERIRKLLPSEDVARIPWERFNGGLFEEWFSYLSEHQPHHDQIAAAGAAHLSLRVTELISNTLSSLQKDALLEQPDPWFYEFLSVLHAMKENVITFNYDNLIECGVHTLTLPVDSQFDASTVCEDDILAGLPPCADFPGISSQSTAARTWAGDPVKTDMRHRGTFKLLKLHGSLSSYWLPDGSGNSTLRRWRLPGIFGMPWDPEELERRQQLPSHEVFIVPPAALKGHRLREPVVRELWRRAAEILQKVERAVLIGYSVPQADHSVMAMLAEGLSRRDVRVEVVNPSPDTVVDRIARLGVPRDAILSIDGVDCIAQWSSREVKRLANDAVTNITADPRLGGEVIVFSAGSRVDRIKCFEFAEKGSSQITLRVLPPSEQCTKPVMYSDLRGSIGSQTELVIDTDGMCRPVIAYWVRERNSGVPMTQLHLMTSH